MIALLSPRRAPTLGFRYAQLEFATGPAAGNTTPARTADAAADSPPADCADLGVAADHVPGGGVGAAAGGYARVPGAGSPEGPAGGDTYGLGTPVPGSAPTDNIYMMPTTLPVEESQYGLGAPPPPSGSGNIGGKRKLPKGDSMALLDDDGGEVGI